MKTDVFKRYAVVAKGTRYIIRKMCENGKMWYMIFNTYAQAENCAHNLHRLNPYHYYEVLVLDEFDKWVDQHQSIIDYDNEHQYDIFDVIEEIFSTKPCSPPRYVHTEGLGIFRIEQQGSGGYIKTYKYLDNVKDKIITVSYKEHRKLENEKWYNNKIWNRYSLKETNKIWGPDMFQRLYDINVDVYFNDDTGECVSEYSAKFCKMIEYSEWLKYPVFDKFIKYRS